MTRGSLVLSMPQFLGEFVDEYSGTYPIYLTAFDATTGILQPQVTMDYDPATRVFGIPPELQHQQHYAKQLLDLLRIIFVMFDARCGSSMGWKMFVGE